MRISLILGVALILIPAAGAARTSPAIAAALDVEVSCETAAELDAQFDYRVEGYYAGGRTIVLRERRCHTLERAVSGWRPAGYMRREGIGIAVFIAAHELEHVAEGERGETVDENRADCLAAGNFRHVAARLGIGRRYASGLIDVTRFRVGYRPNAVARCF